MLSLFNNKTKACMYVCVLTTNPIHACRWQVAAEMKMNVEDKFFIKLLKTLPTDDAWDLTNPAEALMHAEGEERYNLLWRDFDRTATEEGHEEDVVQSCERKGKQLNLGDGAVEVKLEFPEWLQMGQKIQELVVLEARLTSQQAEFKKMEAQAVAMNTAESKKRKTDCSTSTALLTPILENVVKYQMDYKYMQTKDDKKALADMENSLCPHHRSLRVPCSFKGKGKEDQDISRCSLDV